MRSAILVGIYALYVVVVISAPKVRRVFRVHVLGKKHKVRKHFIQQAREKRGNPAPADFEGGAGNESLRTGLLAKTVPRSSESKSMNSDVPSVDEFGVTDSSMIGAGSESVVRVDFVNNEFDMTTEQEDIDAAIEVAHSKVRNGFGASPGDGLTSGILDHSMMTPEGGSTTMHTNRCHHHRCGHLCGPRRW